MNPILIKIFATALAFSQVATRPDAIGLRFDPLEDRAAVVELLRAGCAHMRKAFDIEDINLDELIATAMQDPQMVAGDIKAFKGVDFNDLHVTYRQFCKNERVDNSPLDIGAVIEFFNAAVADLPDDARLKNLRVAGGYAVLDRKNERYAEVYPEHRRMWVALADIPEHVRNAFVTAEDKRFHQHRGIDERGLVRAFITNLAQPGRPQGGSTITQQVAKNLIVGDDVTYERKIREMIVAVRLEALVGKAEILELYLNSIYLGRGSWGVELAARSYFGKPARELTVSEGALLAGLAKGPNYFNPERHPERARERLAYVLDRMKTDGALGADEARHAQSLPIQLVAYERVRRDSGFHFVDQVARELKGLAVAGLSPEFLVVHSTIEPRLQRAAESALQDGLARYEAATGRARFRGAETNLAEAVRRGELEPDGKPAWQRALAGARLPLYDVHWTPAIVVAARKGEGLRVGLADGRVLALAAGAGARKGLQLHDVVYVRLAEKKGARAELRVRPEVQGAVAVLDNASGAILALAGSFSYPLSQLNRATQSQRQPGSTFKPLSYLAALRKGLQPNTIVRDTPLTLPPIGGDGRLGGTPGILADRYAREKDYWSPRNYGGGSAGALTLRRALEHSKNLVTANLLDGAIDEAAEKSLDRVCELALEAQLYKECMRYYPFVLGAQPVRLVDLTAFYAAIANEGARPAPHVIASIEQNGRTVYRNETAPVWLGSADRAAFYQLKSMLQGVVQRGTGSAIKHLAPYVAGKTGTSDEENDAWFIGFTNEVTVGVWVGYDNAEGKRRTLGPGQTGGKVAVPIFEPVMRAVWAHHAPRTALAPPSVEARRHLVAVPINLHTGDPLPGGSPNAFVEYFRLDRSGRVAETQYDLVGREEADALRSFGAPGDGDRGGVWYYGRDYSYVPQGSYVPNGFPAPGSVFQAPPRRSPGLFGLFGEPRWWDHEERRPRRIDPDYFWGRRQYN